MVVVDTSAQQTFENDRQHDSYLLSSRRRHTIFDCDWSSDVCSSDLVCSAGLVCAGTAATTYLDADRDGRGDSNIPQSVCPTDGGWVLVGGDCDEIGRASCRERV